MFGQKEEEELDKRRRQLGSGRVGWGGMAGQGDRQVWWLRQQPTPHPTLNGSGARAKQGWESAPDYKFRAMNGGKRTVENITG
jgi:hypothetical protein